MPVKIACPKCSKNYTLPDSALGKAVKCKACETTFRTRVPGATPANPGASKPAARPGQPTPQRPKQQRSAQPASPNPNEFGLDGGFQKQADIFGSQPPAASAGLQNVSDKDPFGDAADPIVLGPAGASVAPPENPFQSVLTNSSMRGKSTRKKAGNKKRGKGGSADVSAYGVVRAGMMCLFGAGCAVVLSTFVILIMSVLGMATRGGAPPNGEPGAITAVIGIVSLLLFGLNGISFLAMIVGQIMCMFAPNGNERFNAIGAGVLMFLAMVGGLVMTIVVGVAFGGPGGPSQGAAISAGIGFLVVLLICGAMTLAGMFMFVNFYRRIGQNINSDALVKVSNQATIAICIPLVMPVLGFGLGMILGMSGADPNTIGYVMGAFQIFNALILLVVSAVLLRLIWTGISNLAK